MYRPYKPALGRGALTNPYGQSLTPSAADINNDNPTWATPADQWHKLDSFDRAAMVLDRQVYGAAPTPPPPPKTPRFRSRSGPGSTQTGIGPRGFDQSNFGSTGMEPAGFDQLGFVQTSAGQTGFGQGPRGWQLAQQPPVRPGLSNGASLPAVHQAGMLAQLMEAGRRWSAENGEDPPKSPDDDVPVLFMKKERQDSLLADTPAIFFFDDAAGDAKASSPLWEWHYWGWSAVQKYDDLIDWAARKHNVDPRMIRALMYSENSRGHNFLGNNVADFLGWGDSVAPMNINPTLWGGLLGDDADLYDEAQNIEASAILIRRIADRLENPTPVAIASIWNFAGREQPNDFGAYVARMYDEQPWLNPTSWWDFWE